MRMIIDIDEKWEAKCSWFSNRDIKDYLYGIIRTGTPIPDNATNGDVMKIIFPKIGVYDEWYDEPYQKGGK